MAITWGDFRTIIRRSILKDDSDPTAPKWSNDVLLDLCKWAQDAFCAHTALATSINYTSISLTQTLPDDLFGQVETTGRLYLLRSTGAVDVIPATITTRFDDSVLSYSVWNGTLSLNAAQPEGSTLRLFYYAYYPVPADDSSLLALPRWSLNAVAHLIGSYAQTREAIQSAGIDRWKTRDDSGRPDDNALRAQQQWMFKVYENELARFPKQTRTSIDDYVVIP